MGIFSKKNKENNKVSEEKKLVLSMPLFKGKEGYSLDAIVDDLINYWKLDVKDVDGNDEVATFSIDSELVALAFMPAPVPSEELESLCQFSYMWDNAETEVMEHTHHAILSVMSGDASTVDKYSLLTKINASLLRTCDTAIGVYQGSATLLVPKAVYIDFADMLNEDMLPIQLWIYIGLIQENGKTSMYSYGLAEFGKLEMEIINSDIDVNYLFDFLSNILYYIIDQDVTLLDGETIGMSEEQKLTIRESKAVYLEGDSLKIEI